MRASVRRALGGDGVTRSTRFTNYFYRFCLRTFGWRCWRVFPQNVASQMPQPRRAQFRFPIQLHDGEGREIRQRRPEIRHAPELFEQFPRDVFRYARDAHQNASLHMTRVSFPFAGHHLPLGPW